ncbi:hypothetical protein D6817_01570 [Candidatus Pacearchaeota archaeon]|nr:MAG: hypothetical protein D6817_01570 [Candidatus Pacearchaeota archaeon]
MSFIFPALAALLQASSFTIDKIAFRAKKINYLNFTALGFAFLFLFNLLLWLALKPGFGALTPASISLLLVSTSILIATNLLFYRALKKEKLAEMQTLALVSSIPLVLLSFFAFPDEKNPLSLALALLASALLVWSHWEKKHFHLAKKSYQFLLWAIFVMPFAALLTKILLNSFHPITLQLYRDTLVALILIPVLAKRAQRPALSTTALIALSSLLSSIAGVLYLFGFKTLGVIQTVLIFSAEPFLVYLSAILLLKEKIEKKKLVAFSALVILIALSQAI